MAPLMLQLTLVMREREREREREIKEKNDLKCLFVYHWIIWVSNGREAGPIIYSCKESVQKRKVRDFLFVFCFLDI